jgi:hypothetical protein
MIRSLSPLGAPNRVCDTVVLPEPRRCVAAIPKDLADGGGGNERTRGLTRKR